MGSKANPKLESLLADLAGTQEGLATVKKMVDEAGKELAADKPSEKVDKSGQKADKSDQGSKVPKQAHEPTGPATPKKDKELALQVQKAIGESPKSTPRLRSVFEQFNWPRPPTAPNEWSTRDKSKGKDPKYNREFEELPKTPAAKAMESNKEKLADTPPDNTPTKAGKQTPYQSPTVIAVEDEGLPAQTPISTQKQPLLAPSDEPSSSPIDSQEFRSAWRPAKTMSPMPPPFEPRRYTPRGYVPGVSPRSGSSGFARSPWNFNSGTPTKDKMSSSRGEPASSTGDGPGPETQPASSPVVGAKPKGGLAPNLTAGKLRKRRVENSEQEAPTTDEEVQAPSTGRLTRPSTRPARAAAKKAREDMKK